MIEIDTMSMRSNKKRLNVWGLSIDTSCNEKGNIFTMIMISKVLLTNIISNEIVEEKIGSLKNSDGKSNKNIDPTSICVSAYVERRNITNIAK